MSDFLPLNDLKRSHEPLRAEFASAFARVVDSGWFLRGREVAAFEEEWADFCGQKYCVACNSGTDALTIGALALGMTHASVQANTLSLTATGLRHAGVKIDIVDVDADGRITPAPSSVPVLLFGRHPNKTEIEARLFDAAHAHGWRPPVHASACWSFYPSKTLGALGDAGAVTTNDAGVAAAMRNLIGSDDQLRDGRQITSRMDEVQAALLRIKLKHLPGWIRERRAIGAWYIRNLPDAVAMVSTDELDLHHLAVVRTPSRDGLLAWLKAAGVETKIHFATPLHLQNAPWADPSRPRPMAENWCGSILTLPCFPGMTEDELKRVANAIERYFDK